MEIGNKIEVLNPYSGVGSSRAVVQGTIINKTECSPYPLFYTIKLDNGNKMVIPYSLVIKIIEN